MLRDWQSFSNEIKVGNDASPLMADAVIVIDPPRQQKLRKVLNPYFSPARMSALGEQVEQVTDRLIDEFIEAGQGDLAHVAWRQPGIVFFQYVLGMPVDQVPLYLDIIDRSVNGEDADVRLAASIELYEHMRAEIELRQGQPPREDMISTLLEARIDGEPLTFDAIVGNALLLVQAGLETTSSAMSYAFYYLGRHTDQRDQLVQHPGLIPSAVEEFVRFAGSVHGLHRTVTTDVQVGGKPSARGKQWWSITLRRTEILASSTSRIGASSTGRQTGIWVRSRHAPLHGFQPCPHGVPGGARAGDRPHARLHRACRR